MKSIHTFQSKQITAGYDNKTILDDVSFNIPIIK